jgi:hypothetical protein
MRAKILFSLIFALLGGCWIASGQSFIGRPMFPLNSGGVGPESIPHLRFYWVSSDMPTNTVISVWTDRIQGQNIVSTNTGAPTNYAKGVYFNGSSQRLTLTNPFTWKATGGDMTGSVWVVIAPQTGISSSFASIISAAGTPTENSDGYGPMVKSDGVLHWSADAGAADFATFSNEQIIDISAQLYLTNVPSNAIWTRLSTNAVQAYHASINQPSSYIRQIGWRKDLNRFFKGYIKELAFFTNVLTQAEITTLHNYATNTYNFTP